jgi:hypothetical protein
MRTGFGIVAGIVLGCAAIFGIAYGGYAMYAYFAPKYEGVRRDVMINSRFYNEATVRELYRLKEQYDAAKTDEERATIAAAARHEFVIFPRDRLPPDLRFWFAQISH